MLSHHSIYISKSNHYSASDNEAYKLTISLMFDNKQFAKRKSKRYVIQKYRLECS